MVLYNSESEGEDDPMVSGPVNHLEVKVSLQARGGEGSDEGPRRLGLLLLLNKSGHSMKVRVTHEEA